MDRLLFRWILEHQRQAGLTGDLVELGAFEGKSAIVIGDYLAPGETFTVIDLFGTEPGGGAGPRESKRSYASLTEEIFSTNYRKFHSELPRVYAAPSSHVRQVVDHDTVRFIHIDASHAYRDVADDIDAARDLVRDDGVVVLDDFRATHTPGVAAAAWEAVLSKGLRPICVSKNKMYGTWSDPAELQDALAARVEENPRGRTQFHEVAGNRLLRCKLAPRRRTAPVPTPAAAPSTKARLAQDWLPPRVLTALRQVRARG